MPQNSPNIPNMSTQERIQSLRGEARQLASPLPPFMVEAKRVAQTVAAGLHGRRRSGHGDSFWQFRPFQDGDSSTQIDWRRSALGQRIYVREHEWETAQSIWVWRDASGSMQYRSGPDVPEKRDRATVLALASVALLTEAGEQVGILGSGGRPQSGPGVVGRLAESLVHLEDAAAPSLPPMVEVPRHSEMVWVADFLGDIPALDARMRLYAQMGCQGHLIQVLDRAEVTFPYQGQVVFEGLEGEGRYVVSQASGVKAAYEERFQTHQKMLQDLAHHHQWSLVTHFTDQPAEPALMSLGAAMSGAALAGGRR